MKIAIPIDTVRLQKEIDVAESNNTFKNQTELFEFIANTDWAKKTYKKPLSSAVLYLRYKQEALIVKTPKGKRGRAAGTPINRTARKDKLAKNPNFKENIRLLKRNNPTAIKTIDKMAAGSLKAAVRVNCLNCCGGDKKSASQCNVLSCGLYLFNPFLKPDDNGEDE